jgi:molybdopterin molybdotransferase
MDPKSSELITVDEARERILAPLPMGLGEAVLPLAQAAGRVAAAPLDSPLALPPFANSAVDGYALRDLQLAVGETASLRLVGRSAAGRPYEGPALAAGEALRILTGAAVPPEADAVVMQEQTELTDGRLLVRGPLRQGDHVRGAGSDLPLGRPILATGDLLHPARIALLAAAGCREARVHRPVRVAVFATGDELRTTGVRLEPGQIHESNRALLLGLLQAPWVETMDLGIVADDPQLLGRTLTQAAEAADVIVTSGGVSVGDTDHMPRLVAELGRLSFWKVAVKPGKPLAVGRIGAAQYFGLPGNPVSAAVTLLVFVLPALRRLAGLPDPLPRLWPVRLRDGIDRRPGREEYLRGCWVEGSATDGKPWAVALSGQASHQLTGMAAADCLLRVAADRGDLTPGSLVEALPLPWSRGLPA